MVLADTATARLATHGAPFGIRVNSIAPGVIVTPLIRHLEEMAGSPEALAEAMRPVIPMHRYGSAEEATALVALLLSDDASYVTGVIVPIDGGVHGGNPLTR